MTENTDNQSTTNPNYPGSSQHQPQQHTNVQHAHETKKVKSGGNKAIYIAVIVVIIVVALVLVYLNGNNGGASLVKYDNTPVPAQQVAQLENVSHNTTLANKVGPGLVSPYPTTINKTNITKVNGLPAVIYVGAEYCPYCALTRWGLILALMRFGNFTNLHYMTSSSSDSYANTATFTFVNSTYSSPYITFQDAEILTNVYPYQTLQQPDPLESAAASAYDPSGGIPFIDFGNKSVQVGTPPSISPGFISGKNWPQVIATLSDSNATATGAIMGQANIFTAEICAIDNFTPASVCKQPYISKILS
jgi:hypothetical protein